MSNKPNTRKRAPAKAAAKRTTGRTTPPKEHYRPRLLGVIVQPIVAMDNGVHLRPIPTKTTEVSPADWSGYPTGRFVEELAEIERVVNKVGLDRFLAGDLGA